MNLVQGLGCHTANGHPLLDDLQPLSLAHLLTQRVCHELEPGVDGLDGVGQSHLDLDLRGRGKGGGGSKIASRRDVGVRIGVDPQLRSLRRGSGGSTARVRRKLAQMEVAPTLTAPPVVTRWPLPLDRRKAMSRWP